MATAAYNCTFSVTSLPSVSFTNEALTDSGDHTTYTITNSAKRYLDKSIAVVVQRSTDSGATWNTITTGFTLYYVNARITFTSAQNATYLFRFASGSYYPYAQFGDAASAEFAAKVDMQDTTVFNTSGTHSYTPTLLSGTLKCNSYWTNETMVTHLTARDLLVVSFATPSGNRYEGYCYTSDSGLKADTKDVLKEDLTFQLTDQFFAS